ncbi:daptide-type RiPP biosynthesis methyltransferase [Streptomyces sp. NRRL WC-3742]|uniref:daptide-type RiPP biosynthesis methyltransferase n=1 Tax=Streptomyces sp. NRRL WC-3742 TaxID=1463934 RepID=UPI000690FEAC|nr:daptide-type RiPP biosynthesis methyltransferase [Streptomyces sp. NRRL WC-3742]
MTTALAPTPAPAVDEPGTDALADLPGTARRLAAELGPDLIVADMYSDHGGPVYHALSAADTVEIPDLLAAFRGLRGPLLELACGSGRLTIPLLAAGHRVTGIDNSRSLLDVLSGRLLAPQGARLAERLTVVEADMRDLALGKVFAGALLGTTTVGLLDPALRPEVFRSVRRHLAPGAPFVLTVHLPEESGAGTRALGAEPAETVRTSELGDAQCTVISHLVADRSRRYVTVLRTAAGRPPVLLTSVVHLPTADELAAELADAGFEAETTRPVRAAATEDGSVHSLIIARSI